MWCYISCADLGSWIWFGFWSQALHFCCCWVWLFLPNTQMFKGHMGRGGSHLGYFKPVVFRRGSNVERSHWEGGLNMLSSSCLLAPTGPPLPSVLVTSRNFGENECSVKTLGKWNFLLWIVSLIQIQWIKFWLLIHKSLASLQTYCLWEDISPSLPEWLEFSWFNRRPEFSGFFKYSQIILLCF